ncbi:DUF481 domain-containing protein [Aliivibrio kagoshimensis]|uniref:DUF481 domain-containing protein n=1 Tax=Aliivibrio kagoshimensis TaxID=2910230 RepID=UPI003D0FEFC5
MTKIFAAALLLFTHAAYCETTEPTPLPSPWDNEIEFGYQSESGNNSSQAINYRLELNYTKGQMRNSGEIKYAHKEDEGIEKRNQMALKLQTDYKISSDYYLYANLQGMDSKYTAYYKDFTFSSGLGYQVSNTKTLVIELEAGPGYRYQEPNLDEIDDDDLIFPDVVEEGIFRGNIYLKWKMFDSLEFEADATVVTGHSNTRLDTEVSLINNLTEHTALKFSQTREMLERVPAGLEKVDRISSITLLVHF